MDLEQVALSAAPEVRPAVETQFIERLKRGEADAFEILVADRSGEIYGLLYRLTENPEEARDLTQETFLRAFQNIGSFRGDADLRTWIYRIAINQARNRWRWWRRRRRDATVSLDAPDGPFGQPLTASLRAERGEDPEQQTLARERERALRSALRTLGASYRETVVLRDIEGFSYEEIAVTLDISIGAVKSRRARSRRLRENWKDFVNRDGGRLTITIEILRIVHGQWSIVANYEWLTRPGSQQLGAKWVDVNGGVRAGRARRAN
jgi:RNA polymerase sigma-70 factor (ECF subfamily)